MTIGFKDYKCTPIKKFVVLPWIGVGCITVGYSQQVNHTRAELHLKLRRDEIISVSLMVSLEVTLVEVATQT